MVWLAGAALIGAAPVFAQRSISLTGKPDAVITDGFTAATAVRELPGNTAIVTDQFEHQVFLANFAAGTRRQIGRQGDGPGEYRFPTWPIAMPANGTMMYDATLRRIHVIGADGKFGAGMPAPSTGMAGGILAARGADATGRLYFEGNSFDSETGRFSDSVAVVRWDAKTGKTDIVARVWSGGRVMVERSFGKASMARSVTPFPAMDAWVALPDGKIASVEHDPFRIVTIDAGAKHPAPVIPYAPIAITAGDRAAYNELHSTQRSSAVLKNGGSGNPVRSEPIADAEFPKTMPAFIADAVRATPEGEIWIGRSHASSDKTWRYDIFDAQGKLTGSATIGATSTVVGFGVGTVYVARRDPSDDLVYLERYRR
jgi:hypothetical protein